MKLRTLRVEILELENEVTEDEVDVIEMMLKTTQIRLGYRTGVTVVNKGVKEISPSQKWNALGVASTTTTQENTDRQVVTTMARLVI